MRTMRRTYTILALAWALLAVDVTALVMALVSR
jgi:hypothetical protein